MSHLSKALILGFITGLLGLVVSVTGFGFALEENIGLDLLFKLRGTRAVPPDVVVVSIDQETTDHLNLPDKLFEWPRSLHARLIRNLMRQGATAIGFDLFFRDSRSVEDDTSFANAIQEAGNVVLLAYLERETVAGQTNQETVIPPILPFAQATMGIAPFPLPRVPIKVTQFWTFKTAAGRSPTLPVVMFQLFALEVYEEFIHLLERVSPSHAGRFPRDKDAIMATEGIHGLVELLRETFESEPLLGQKMLKALENGKGPFDDAKKNELLKNLIKMYQSADSQYLNFYGPPHTVNTISYHEILDLDETPSPQDRHFHLNGKAVFVGVSERSQPVQRDNFYTVFTQSDGLDLSGVEIAASAFANLLEGMPVRPLPVLVQLIFVFLWGLLMSVLCRLLPPTMAAISALGLSTAYLFTTHYQFSNSGVWHPLVLPLLFQTPFAFFGSVLWKYFDTKREREHLRKVFGYYLPDEALGQIWKKAKGFEVSSRTVYGICLSTDAERYTSLAETMSPEELSQFMNRYYEVVFTPVRQHGGIVSDVVGDSMMAIWATTCPDAVLRTRAGLAALDIARAVDRFNRPLYDTMQLPTRIGVHSGFIVLGDIGAIDHYEYRAVGDIVNTASRIESLNKHLGTQILVSSEVLDQLNDFLARELGAFLLFGKSKSLVVHELMGCLEESTGEQRALCEIFAEALDAFKRRSWNEAIKRFNTCTKIRGEDGPSLFYLNLCERYRKHPPEKPWHGIIRMDDK